MLEVDFLQLRGASHASSPPWRQHGRVSVLSLSLVSLLPYTSIGGLSYLGSLNNFVKIYFHRSEEVVSMRSRLQL